MLMLRYASFSLPLLSSFFPAKRVVKFGKGETNVLRSHQSYPIPTVIPSPNITLFYGANISTFRPCKPSMIPRGSLLFNCADHFATHSVPPFISLFHVAHMLNGYLYIHAILRENQHSNRVRVREVYALNDTVGLAI